MRSFRTFLLCTTLAAASQARAQDAQKLPEVVASGDRISPTYEPGKGADSGTTRIEAGEIQARAPGSGDANQLLKILPTVQFSRETGLATREDIQDIRPADISISGGRLYDNLFTLDGIDTSSRLNTVKNTTNTAFNFNELVDASPQSLWLDTNLVGAITLRDSNVSAEFGRFTGGALDIEMRKPRPVFGGSATVSYTADGMTSLKIADGVLDRLAGVLPDKPVFEKIRYGMTLDVPVTDSIQTLFAANRSRADVTYYRNATYGGRPFGQHSLSSNYLAKVIATLDPATRLTAQVAYSPYESEAASANGINNQITTKGGGITGRMLLEHDGPVTWSVQGSVVHSNSGREAPPEQYSISSQTSVGGPICSGTNCTIGGFGDLKQQQTNYALAIKGATDLGPGRLSGGVDLQRINAVREREKEVRAYQTAALGTNILCAAGDSLTCVSGEYALTRYQQYRAYRADVSLDSIAAWAEYRLDSGPFDVRAGVRYDRESYLGNDNLAPRFSAAYTLPGTRWSIGVGANRYFGRSLLVYALREQYPANFTYLRTPVNQGGRAVYSDNYTLSATSKSTAYTGTNALRTPRSDELTATLNAPILGGMFTVRGIYRRGANELTRSLGVTQTTVLENGRTTTYTEYGLTNGGSSRYRGASVEWQRNFGKHTIALNTNFSKTSTTNDDYLATADDLLEGDLVAFEGKVYQLEQLLLLSSREDYASPFFVNASWSAKWWKNRLTTNLNLRYLDPFRRIEDTGTSTTIDGQRYQQYAWLRYPASIDANLNVQAELLRNEIGALTLDLRIANLFDRIPVRNATAIAQPYQFGRSVWTGLTFRF